MSRVSSMQELVRRSVTSFRTTAGLLGLFAALALVLGAVGVYGGLSYRVTSRRREIGIRMALGADRRDVRRLIVGLAAGLIGAGVRLGLVTPWLGRSALRGFVYGVTVRDPVTFVAVPLVFVLVGLVATYLPARRATLVAPVETLKEG